MQHYQKEGEERECEKETNNYKATLKMLQLTKCHQFIR